jgi:hypothetical protein
MSAQPYDAEPAGGAPLAAPAVDVLPAAIGRRTKFQAPEAEATPADQSWGQVPPGAVNPWTGVAPATEGAPAAPAYPDAAYPDAAYPDAAYPDAAYPDAASPASTYPVPAYPAATHPVAAYPVAAYPPATYPAPVYAPDGAAPAQPDAAYVEGVHPAGGDEPPPAKRFLGMALRRGRRGSDEADPAGVEPTSAPLLAPTAPLAAWPTDVGVQAVAQAEPGTEVAPPPEATTAAVEHSTIAHPVFPGESAPAAVEPTPIAAPAPVPVAVVEPAAAVLAPAEDEVRSLREHLEASEARAAVAQNRADQAVAYAQQLQAELTSVQEELQAKLQAAETRVRTLANDGQDWQIRHREAEAQIAELAASLAGAEQRVADLRAERDELMTALEDATEPERVADSDRATSS